LLLFALSLSFFHYPTKESLLTYKKKEPIPANLNAIGVGYFLSMGRNYPQSCSPTLLLRSFLDATNIAKKISEKKIKWLI